MGETAGEEFWVILGEEDKVRAEEGRTDEKGWAKEEMAFYRVAGETTEQEEVGSRIQGRTARVLRQALRCPDLHPQEPWPQGKETAPGP